MTMNKNKKENPNYGKSRSFSADKRSSYVYSFYIIQLVAWVCNTINLFSYETNEHVLHWPQ